MPVPLLAPADFTLLCEVIALVARSGGLTPDQAEDFTQSVQLRLLERNYAPLKAFGGRCSFRTFLTVVVRRLLLDWRNQQLGKWRPSACAQRLGPVAVRLDRLMSRDGHGVEDAVSLLADLPAFPKPDALREIALQLPQRTRVRLTVPEKWDDVGVAAFVDPVEAEQAALARHCRLRALRRACRRLPVEDRRLLFLRFQRGMTVRQIATVLETDDKPLYRRLARLLSSLRRTLIAAQSVESAEPRRRGRGVLDSSTIH
jgi:RNA polymerase sigma factor (sigma-70 family)